MKDFVFFLMGLTFLTGASAEEASGPQEVHTGVYLMNLYDLNVNEYSFYADFYVWFRWKGEIDPTDIEFVNSVEKWGFTIEPFYDEPKTTADGRQYNGMRVEGRFYHSFDLHRFPLDKHRLSIRLENADYSTDSLVYVPDTAKTLLRKDFIIPGWKIESAEMTSHTNAYETDFGEPSSSRSEYSNFSLSVNLKRPVSYFTLKLMLPLLVVILASLGALFIYPSYMDARISLPIGGLLSCVFLQQSYSSALPDVGYMVLMDQIYLLSYTLIAVILLKIMMGGNAMAKFADRDTEKAYRQNRRFAMVLFGAYLLGIGLLIVL